MGSCSWGSQKKTCFSVGSFLPLLHGSKYWMQALRLAHQVLYLLSHSPTPMILNLMILYFPSAGITPCVPLCGIVHWTQGFLHGRQDPRTLSYISSFFVPFEPVSLGSPSWSATLSNPPVTSSAVITSLSHHTLPFKAEEGSYFVVKANLEF